MEGNEAIARGLADRVRSQIRHAKQLMKLERLASGRIRLWFHDGQSADHDAVVLAIPFTILRTLDLSASGLPSWKRLAIDRLGYGTNAKMMVGFNSPFWRQLGSNGASYSDLANHQATWETNPSAATAEHAVLTDYSGAARGQNLNLLGTQAAAGLFISDLERVFPGAIAMATRNGGQYLAHLEHWPSNPLTRGSYTSYLPGQFTTIAGNEGKAVDSIFFAGEHANSFYEFQGFMEGAALSGIQAAAAILRKPKN
jgi:monoamine oxidase